MHWYVRLIHSSVDEHLGCFQFVCFCLCFCFVIMNKVVINILLYYKRCYISLLDICFHFFGVNFVGEINVYKVSIYWIAVQFSKVCILYSPWQWVREYRATALYSVQNLEIIIIVDVPLSLMSPFSPYG